MDIGKLDTNMAITAPKEENGITWHAPYAAPMELEGLAFFDEDHVYRRLPLDTETQFSGNRQPMNDLSWHPSGSIVRFRANAHAVHVKVTLKYPCGMYHMTAVGQGGFDCYIRRANDANYRFAGATAFDCRGLEYSTTVWTGDDADTEEKEFLLHLPLYQRVESLWIGLPSDAQVRAPKPHTNNVKMALYGTSIDQGACASRPGLALTAQLGRKLDCPWYNFGFSGNAWLDLPMADVFARIADLRVLIVNVESNAGPFETLHTMPEFLQAVREKCPDLEILVCSAPTGPIEAQIATRVALKKEWRSIQERAVAARIAAGDDKIHFLDGRSLWRDDEDYTIDGAHPNDMGFTAMADALYPFLADYIADLT